MRQHQKHTAAITTRALAVLLVMALALVTGCAKRPVPTTPDAASGSPASSTATQADKAWEAEDHASSEVLNRRLLDRGGLTKTQQAMAWERLAVSAVNNGHGHVSLEALRKLTTLRPGSSDTWQWNEVYLRALILIGHPDQARLHMDSLLRDHQRPWELRFRAGLSLARDQWNERRYEQAMQTLERLYGASPAPAPVSQASLERAFLEELKITDRRTLDDLASIIPPESQWNFPYTIVRLEQARRFGQSTDTWPQAWQLLNNLSRLGNIADPSLVAMVASPLQQEQGVPGGGVALALPMSGPYAEIGWKVLRGVGAAQWEALTGGAQLNIRVINTEASDWIERIEALPSGFAIMGGPLRQDKFEALVNRGLTTKRPCFAFLPRLSGAVEGMDAWRFFSSPRDEARALVSLAVGETAINEFAVLYPQEPYGNRSSEVFMAEVEDWFGEVTAIGSYPPAQPTQWSKSVAPLLGVDSAIPEEEREPVAPPFQAIFVPDGWSQAKILIPQLFFYNEDRLLVLGPALWGQGLAKDENVEMNYFRTAVFPGPWWADNPAPGTSALRTALAADGLGAPDFWVALGYDFMRFAGMMPPLSSNFNPDSVNSALQIAAGFDWSMAPLVWDVAGRVQQELFLFRPTRKGIAPLDLELLNKRLEDTRKRHEQRVIANQEKRELDELKKLQEAQPDNEEVNQRLQLLLDTIEQRKAEENEQ
ncbi:penicillin-binding protein activator [Desulfovibrio ferrophilus]|nr:penicillin-binding protein activator [Desulfovibrio ferrophilus]